MAMPRQVSSRVPGVPGPMKRMVSASAEMAAIGSRSSSRNARRTSRAVSMVGITSIASRAMPIRAATRDDLDEICALIVELAEYEQLVHEVEFDRDVMGEHL